MKIQNTCKYLTLGGIFSFCFIGLTLLPSVATAAVQIPQPQLATVGGFNPMLVGALGLGVIGLGLRKPADDEGGEGGGGGTEALDPQKALEQIEDKTLTLGQRLGIAAKALRGIDPTNQLAAVKQSLKDTQDKLSAKETELGSLQAKLAAATKELEARQADVTALESSNASLEKEKAALVAKEQDLEKRADAKAKDKVAGLGFAGNKLPDSDESLTAETPQTREQLEAAIEKAPNLTERRKLLQAHRKLQEK